MMRTPCNSCASDCPAAFGRTQRVVASAAKPNVAANDAPTRNVLRQPIASTASCTGVAAAMAPVPPTAVAKPMYVATCACGVHIDTADRQDMSMPAAPSPSSARPTIISPMPCANPNTVAPAPIVNSSAPHTRLGPNRSSAMPIGICAAAKVRK